MNFSYSIKVKPQFEPIEVSELKTHLRITTSDEDEYLETLIEAARQRFEDETRRSLLTTTWVYRADCLEDIIYLERTPVKSVTHIKYYDETDTLQVLDSSNYLEDLSSSPARIQIITRPSSIKDRINAIEIEFVAGETAQNKIPQNYKRAIKLIAAEAYECRENPVSMKRTAADILIDNAAVIRY